MKRTAFLLLLACFYLQGPVGALEIYVDGKKYDSFASYKASERNKAQVMPKLSAKPLSEETRHRLYLLGIETGVIGAMRSFDHPNGSGGYMINGVLVPQELESVLAQTVGSSEIPKLLIIEPGKLRIMALTADDKSFDSK